MQWRIRNDDEIASNYFSFLNNAVGSIALGLAATALQFEHPEPFALVFAVVTFVWIVSERGEYARVAKRYVERYKGVVGSIHLALKIKLFVIGFSLLVLVANGVITVSKIYVWAGY